MTGEQKAVGGLWRATQCFLKFITGPDCPGHVGGLSRKLVIALRQLSPHIKRFSARMQYFASSLLARKNLKEDITKRCNPKVYLQRYYFRILNLFYIILFAVKFLETD